MVSLYQVISEIITEIEYENSIMLEDKFNNKYIIDLDYLRHHHLLKDAKIFRLILGFENGLWKKNKYDKEKYAEIFNDFNFTKDKWIIFREFLNIHSLSCMERGSIKHKKKVLFDISCTFGGIPSIDKFVEKTHKEKQKVHYNPLKPKQDKLVKYNWSIMNSTSTAFNVWLNDITRKNWEIVHTEKVSLGRMYYARNLK